MKNVEFCRIKKNDLPLLHQWLNQDFIVKWYSNKEMSMQMVEEKYIPRINKQQPVYCFIIKINDKSIGFIQYYFLKNFPDGYIQHLKTIEGVVGIDVFIGEKDYLYQGYGSMVIKQFVEELLTQKGIHSCIVSPNIDNVIAIQSYQKAGFVGVKNIEVNKEIEYLMEYHHTKIK